MGSGGASEDDGVPRWWASAPFPGGCVTLGCMSPGVLQCTRCHVARYCGQACQRRHWKGPLPRGAQTHRDFCVDDYSEQRAIEIAGPERDGGGRDGGVCAGHFAGVVVEVGPGEGSGLLNPMVNHVLPAAKPYLASALVLAVRATYLARPTTTSCSSANWPTCTGRKPPFCSPPAMCRTGLR